MIAVGAIIEHAETGKILLIRRSDILDWHPNEWEIHYGRIGQFEDPEESLRREIAEETGLTDIEIEQLLAARHVYRGEKREENDMVILTHYCISHTTEVTLSHEHSDYGWFDPLEAIDKVVVEGIKDDIRMYLDYRAGVSKD